LASRAFSFSISSRFSSLRTDSLTCSMGMASTCFSYSRSLARLRAICSRTFLSVVVLMSEEMLPMLLVSMSSWPPRGTTEEGREAR